MVLSAILLTLAFAPFGQFYLAWIGLVPWLLVVHRASSMLKAALWSWLAGTLFFGANMYWLVPVNGLGMIALMVYCGLFWGLIAWLTRAAGLLHLRAVAAALAIAAVWTAGEYVRAHLFTGLPLLFFGDTQTPILPMCQIADTLGVYGVSFWLVSLNVLGALLLIRGASRKLLPDAAVLAALTAASLAYGVWRMDQTATTPGPMVMVVQSNDPQSNKGEKSMSDEELLKFHLDTTRQELARLGGKPGTVNLSVWSETVMPPLNHQIHEIEYTMLAHNSEMAIQGISALAAENRMGVLTGARYWDKFHWIDMDGEQVKFPADQRNSAYLFQPDGTFGDGPGERYDKIHLVPFGEFIPFKHSIPFLYRLFLWLGPHYYAEYELQDGSDNGLTVFALRNAAGAQAWRFVTPICFEDGDSALCAAMFRPGADGRKRADFIVNITNDGWFTGGENAQHLQSAVFRSIENRVPQARSVNTGISGFVDSVGHISNVVPVRTAGANTAQLLLDDRLSPYTRWGDWFAWMCVIFSGGAATAAYGRRFFHGA